MDKNAIDAAQTNLAKAEASLRAMQAAKEYSEFQTSWSNFLTAAGRVYSKLKEGAKVNGKSNPWFGGKIHERKTDSLLAYIHHARNADEHGIKPITEQRQGSISIESTGVTHLKQIEISRDGRMTIGAEGHPLKVTAVPNSAQLIPVTDSGITYDTPQDHQGAPIQDQSPAGIAKLAIGYLGSMIAEAQKL